MDPVPTDKSATPVTLRRLTPADIPAAQRLRALANWNQTDADWQRLIAFEPDGCFAAEINGELAGTATTTRFIPSSGPGSFGWIGMLLVDPQHRRRGIGSALLNKCIAHLEEAGVETIKLDATPLGKKVYGRLGFRTETIIERWERVAETSAIPFPCKIEPRAPILSGELAAFDTPIFGANRRRILEAWRDAWPECAFAARAGNQLIGYALARRGERFQQIGPVVGKSLEISESLLGVAVGQLANENIVIDILAENIGTRKIMKSCGFRFQRELIRMFRGKNASPGLTENILAICCPELG